MVKGIRDREQRLKGQGQSEAMREYWKRRRSADGEMNDRLPSSLILDVGEERLRVRLENLGETGEDGRAWKMETEHL